MTKKTYRGLAEPRGGLGLVALSCKTQSLSLALTSAFAPARVRELFGKLAGS